MAEENVKVAVRVRPFNQREKDANSKLVVAMAGNQTLITNPKTNEEKKFAFDYSYWSHDSFKTDSTGYMSAENPKYADQKKVFADLGAGILKNAWEGFNASLFAYGQTGSGKSYSVVGYGTNKGIVPMCCEDIFKNADAVKQSGKTVEVTFSMLEIYSEITRDLLTKEKQKEGLMIREDPKIGFYPQGLKKVLVGSYADITKLMDEGTANRTIAATNMNATSSRAHTIVTISLVQKYKNEAGKEMAKSSLINLVDLAGSERADQTGATGDRLKEGAAINLSLTSLGNVISALADNSAGKNVRVPYRDSVLTKLLMNALGGNSKTIMIAAISPADINYDESLSTLRYADRAKQIKTKAMVNEDPTEKLIKDLREENARLKKMLESGKIDPALLQNSDGSKNPDAAKKEEEAMKKQLEENDKAMKAMQQSYEEKLAAAQSQTQNLEASKLLEKAKTIPHIRNVNMDPSLSGTIRHLFEGEGTKTVGLPGKGDIGLNGIGILEKHGAITNKGGKFTIERFGEAKLLRNGKLVSSPSELVHLDRLLFGALQYYVFIEPSKMKANDPYYTFEAMQDEIAKASGIIGKDTKNMSQDEIKCQSELVDLLPAIEEANAISMALDKKVIFTALPVSADARGDYDGKFQAYVSVRNFPRNLEWIWTKNKFLDRKAEFTELYNDFKDDGVINTAKFKNYDPFFESPDVPTQLGTAIIFPKSFAYMMSNKTDSKVLSLKSQEAGTLNVEILPCNGQGKVLTEKDGIIIRDPSTELLNKNVSFIFKINSLTNINPAYEDIYCQFKIFNDPTVYKTETLKGDKGFNFNFSKQFTYNATKDFLDFLLTKCLYIQIFAEQKHTKEDPALTKMTTTEFINREKEMKNTSIAGKEVLNNIVDPEKQKLKDDLNIALMKLQRTELTLNGVKTLSNMNPDKPEVSNQALKSILIASNQDEIAKILQGNYAGGPRPGSGNSTDFQFGIFKVDIDTKGPKSKACIIQ